MPSNPSGQPKDPINPAIASEISHLRFCFQHDRREKLTGMWLISGGGITAGASAGLYQNYTIDENTAGFIYISGGAMMLTGYVMQLTCNRWLKKASLRPADSGIGLKLNF